MDVGEDVLVVEAGSELICKVREYALRQGLDGVRFAAQGVFDACVVGQFSAEASGYVDVPMEGPVAIVTLAGHVTRRHDGLEIGAHGVFTARGGSCQAGHLRSGVVRSRIRVTFGEPKCSGTRECQVA